MRALLGRTYLAAGRFRSANTAFSDALTLDPSMSRVLVSRALTQIALGDSDGARITLAKAEGIASTVLSIDGNKAGPYGDFAREADVTVMLYVGRRVKANHTFAKGQMKEKGVEAVLADLPKILPEKKGK